jgi:hypothetical protein
LKGLTGYKEQAVRAAFLACAEDVALEINATGVGNGCLDWEVPAAQEGRVIPARRRTRMIDAIQAAKQARKAAEAVGIGLENIIGSGVDDDDNWIVRAVVLETQRIPNTDDILAEYQFELDGEDGSLLGYEQVKRFARSDVGG